MKTPHIDHKIFELSSEIKERLKTAEYIESKILSWYQQTRDEKFAEFFDIVNTRKNSNP